MSSPKIIDISPTLSEETAVFPGDQVFSRDVAMDFSKGDHLALSSIRTTVHIGAHVDAPNHYHGEGEGIDQRDLGIYMGPCQVISVPTARGERIRQEDLGEKKIKAPRVLFHTGSFPNPNRWNDDFCSLCPNLVDFLATSGVILVGIDTPSIDPASSKKLEAHQKVYSNNMAILEGVVLNHVKEGLYKLIALPLKIDGGDASPVRAVLVDLSSSYNPLDPGS